MALGPLVESAALTTKLKQLALTDLASVEDVAFLTAESWLRASSFSDLCPREEVIVSVNRLRRTRKIEAPLRLILEHGKALHHQLQNSILPAMGVLLGEWECVGCRKHYGVQDSSVAVSKWAMPRPSQCSCRSREFLYVEASFVNHDYRLTGHSDGFLRITGMNGLGVFEGKSISQQGAWKVKSMPLINHVVQAQIYMWLADLKWGRILYWDKGGLGMDTWIEHHIDRDDEQIDKIKETIQMIWDGVASGKLPEERICASPDAPRATTCVAKDPCFA